MAETEDERITRRVDDPLEVDDFVEPVSPAPHDQSFDRRRAASRAPARIALRTLARILPLGYGAFVGTMASNSLLGLVVGALISMMVDLSLEQHSILRGAYRGLIARACPFAAAAAQVLVRAVAGMGMPVRSTWGQVKCGAAR